MGEGNAGFIGCRVANEALKVKTLVLAAIFRLTVGLWSKGLTFGLIDIDAVPPIGGGNARNFWIPYSLA